MNNVILFSPQKLISNPRTLHSCKGNSGPRDFKRCPSSHIKQQTNKEKYVALSYMDSYVQTRVNLYLYVSGSLSSGLKHKLYYTSLYH